MKKDKTPRRPETQLLQNRGILSKVNAVVRKKSKKSEKAVPVEWEEPVSQAFRLLVGPKIRDYVSMKQEITERPIYEKTAGKREAERLWRKLTPSRLREKMEPLKVTNDNLKSLKLPPDLLCDPFPGDDRPKSDLLPHYLNQKRAKLVFRPRNVPEKPSVQKPEITIPSSASITAFVTASERRAPRQRGCEEEEEEEFVIAESKVIEPCAIPAPVLGQDRVTAALETGDTLKGERKLRNETKIRMRRVFYSLRCWSRFRINARRKAAFIVNVFDTRIVLHATKKWHNYSMTMVGLRRKRVALIGWKESVVFVEHWKRWKTKVEKAIRNVGVCDAAVKRRNEQLCAKYLMLFHEAAHERRIFRLEVERFFRYNPDGPSAKLNPKLTLKRARFVKAMHFRFFRSASDCIRGWFSAILQIRDDRKKSGELTKEVTKIRFNRWFSTFQEHFHERVMCEIRVRSKRHLKDCQRAEFLASERVKKTQITQVLHDNAIVNAKLSNFDRLAERHQNSVKVRKDRMEEIEEVSRVFFRRQEEEQLVGFTKDSVQIARRVNEVRCQLAEGFLYHMGRVARSYDNQITALQFCQSFRILAQPLVEVAASFFAEQREMRKILDVHKRQAGVLRMVEVCTRLWHQGTGYGWWKRFMESITLGRTPGLMDEVRRRIVILQLFPYFGLTEILPVRPPRPFREVEMLYKDLPLLSIQRKVARERIHHVNVRMMLMQRRILRDFLRSYASYVQERIVVKKVVALLRKKRGVRLLKMGYRAFTGAVGKEREGDSVILKGLSADILAWHRHFFKQRAKVRTRAKEIPFS
jgi:hypothetical protein